MASSRRSTAPAVFVFSRRVTTSTFWAGVASAGAGKSAWSDTCSSWRSILAISLSQSRDDIGAPVRARAPLRVLAREAVPLDLLVQVRPRHVERPRGLAHVPVELAELGDEEGALRGVLELLERLHLEQVAHARAVAGAPPDQAVH